MTGVHQYDEDASPEERALQDIMCKCHQNPPPPAPPGDCKEVGVAKHECCEKAIKDHKAPPEIGGERGYDKNGSEFEESREVMSAQGTIRRDDVFPDACAMSDGRPTQFFDFKFPCGGESDGDFYMKKKRGLTQYERYLRLSKQLGIEKPPKCISARACR